MRSSPLLASFDRKQPAAGGNIGPNILAFHSPPPASDCNNILPSLPRHSHSAGGLGFGTMPVLGTQPGCQVHHPDSSIQQLSHRGKKRNASHRQLSGLPRGPLTVSGAPRSTPTRYGPATPEPNDGVRRRWFPTESRNRSCSAPITMTVPRPRASGRAR